VNNHPFCSQEKGLPEVASKHSLVEAVMEAAALQQERAMNAVLRAGPPRAAGRGATFMRGAATSTLLLLLGAGMHAFYTAKTQAGAAARAPAMAARSLEPPPGPGSRLGHAMDGLTLLYNTSVHGSPDTGLTPKAARWNDVEEAAGWLLRQRLGRGDGASRRRAKREGQRQEQEQNRGWPDFWQYKAGSNFVSATALYVGLRVLPRCTMLVLALVSPELLRESGVDLSSLWTWLLWLAFPYVNLFLLVAQHKSTHPYAALLAGWLAFARTKWEVEWVGVLLSYITAQLAHGLRGRHIDETWGPWAPAVKAALIPTSLLFNCVLDTAHKFTSLNSLTAHALILLLCSRRVCELAFFFYHRVDPLIEMSAFLLACLPAPRRHNNPLFNRLRAVARPWANRMAVFLVGDGPHDAEAGRLPVRVPPPATHWPAPLSVDSLDDEADEAEVPHDFRCGITMTLMRLPASTPTGEVFDYEPLATWIQLKGTHPTDPLRPLTIEQLHPNLYLRNQIEQWLATRQAAKEGGAAAGEAPGYHGDGGQGVVEAGDLGDGGGMPAGLAALTVAERRQRRVENGTTASCTRVVRRARSPATRARAVR